MKLSTNARAYIMQGVVVYMTLEIRIYSGAMPATGDTAPTGTLLAAFDPVLGSWDVSAVVAVPDVPGNILSIPAYATGTAGYAMVVGSYGSWMYLTVGTSGAEVNLSALQIYADGVVVMKSAGLSMPTT